MAIPKDKEIEVTKLIQEAMRDLDEFYSKIRKSEKILKYKNDRELLGEIFICILSSFSMMQILEFTSKAKMIENESGKVLSRKERFIVGLSVFQQKFELFVNQQLGHLE